MERWRDEGEWRGERRFEDRDERRFGGSQLGEGRTGSTERADWERERDRELGRGGQRRFESQGGYGPSEYAGQRQGYGQQGYGQPHGGGSWGQQPGATQQGGWGSAQFGGQAGYGTQQAPWPEGPGYGAGQYGGPQQGQGMQTGYGGWGQRQAQDFGWRSSDVQRGGRSEQREGVLERIRRGRPPRAYQRSDERIRDELIELIVRESDIDASDVDIQVQGGEVILSGEVETRSAKRDLEDLAERVFGVKDVHDRLKVRQGLMSELGERLFGREGKESKPEQQRGIPPRH